MSSIASPTDIAKRWDVFLQRRAFLMSGTLGFNVYGETVSHLFITGIIVSMLYVDLVSILDLATTTQLTPKEVKRLNRPCENSSLESP